jgi:hypothetical protein
MTTIWNSDDDASFEESIKKAPTDGDTDSVLEKFEATIKDRMARRAAEIKQAARKSSK